MRSGTRRKTPQKEKSAEINDYVAKRKAAMERAARLREERKAAAASGGGGGGGAGAEQRQANMAAARAKLGLYGQDLNNPDVNPFARRAVAAAPAPPQQQQPPPQQPQHGRRGGGGGHGRGRSGGEDNPFSRPGSRDDLHAGAAPPAADGSRVEELEAEVARLREENARLTEALRDKDDEAERLRFELSKAKRAAKGRAGSSRTPGAKKARSPPPEREDETRPTPSRRPRQKAARLDVGFGGAADEEPARFNEDAPLGGKGSYGGFDDQPVGGGGGGGGFDDQPVGGGGGGGGGSFGSEYPDEYETPARPKRRSAAASSKRRSRPPPREEPPAYDDDYQAGAYGGGGGGGAPANDLDELPVGQGNNDLPDEFAKATKVYPCKHCGRTFNKKALGFHTKSKVCQKKAKPKDFAAARLGAVADVRDVKQIKAKLAKEKRQEAKKKKSGGDGEVPKWKRDRDALRAAMRAAKQVNQAIKDGVDLRDLPPPPPSNVPDGRTPCPHCGRKFNATAAERHIPSCAKRNSRTPARKAAPRRRY